jgi:hypothetical protein
VSDAGTYPEAALGTVSPLIDAEVAQVRESAVTAPKVGLLEEEEVAIISGVSLFTFAFRTLSALS